MRCGYRKSGNHVIRYIYQNTCSRSNCKGHAMTHTKPLAASEKEVK